jgi:hypothetical protein
VVSSIAISSQMARNALTVPAATRRRIVRARIDRAVRIVAPLGRGAPAGWWASAIIVGFLSLVRMVG